MIKKSVLMAILSAGAACVFQTQTMAMEHGEMMDHSAMDSGAMTQVEMNGATQGTGVINTVDAAGRSVKITHEPIPALSWPSMTMDLPVTEHVDLSAIKPGDKVDFKLDLGSDDVYRITQIKQEN